MQFSYVRDPDARELPAAGMAAGLNATLRERNRVIVTAPPGAGKSTLLPLTLLEGLDESASRQKGRILMLEPRRLAARQVALRMAALSGTRPGELVGYRMRFETCVSPQTRIEVLTEGILTRMLVADPTLEGVEAVLFDEFHERSLTADVALALTREAQRLIRPDLKIVLMSATLDAAGLCEALDAPLLACEGRQFPVEIHHSPCPISGPVARKRWPTQSVWHTGTTKGTSWPSCPEKRRSANAQSCWETPFPLPGSAPSMACSRPRNSKPPSRPAPRERAKWCSQPRLPRRP